MPGQQQGIFLRFGLVRADFPTFSREFPAVFRTRPRHGTTHIGEAEFGFRENGNPDPQNSASLPGGSHGGVNVQTN